MGEEKILGKEASRCEEVGLEEWDEAVLAEE
jgi:hypothetical protein